MHDIFSRLTLLKVDTSIHFLPSCGVTPPTWSVDLTLKRDSVEVRASERNVDFEAALRGAWQKFEPAMKALGFDVPLEATFN